jgi:hypothetical protein
MRLATTFDALPVLARQLHLSCPDAQHGLGLFCALVLTRIGASLAIYHNQRRNSQRPGAFVVVRHSLIFSIFKPRSVGLRNSALRSRTPSTLGALELFCHVFRPPMLFHIVVGWSLYLTPLLQGPSRQVSSSI